MFLRALFVTFSGALMWAGVAFSQTGTVSGKVIDGDTKETIIGANVVSFNDRMVGAATDIDGNFSFQLPVGKQKIICSFTGMQSDTVEVSIIEGDTVTLNIELIMMAEQLGVVVVSAGRFEQKLEELTVSMEVLKPTLVENKNSTSIDQALEQTPGLTIMDSEPQIRGGSGFSFGIGSRVAILVDDLPLMSGDAGKTEWSFIPVENLEQVEVVKGASSVLYGSSALSGVINIRTAYPKDTPQTKINIYNGFYSSPDASLTPAQDSNATDAHRFGNIFGLDTRNATGSKWWDGVANYAGMNFFHSRKIGNFDLVIGGNAYYDHNFIGPHMHDSASFLADSVKIDNSEVAERRGRLNFDLRYRFKKVEGLSIGIKANVMKSLNNFSLLWVDQDTGIYRAFPGSMTLQEMTLFHVDPYLTYYTKGGARHSVKMRYFYTDNQNSGNQSNTSSVLYSEYQFQKSFPKIKDFKATAGVAGTYTNSEANLYAGSGSPHNYALNFAGYLQLDKKFWKVLSISGGFRYEYFQINNVESVGKPIGRAGVNLKLGKGTYVRGSWGQGFRFPTIAEKYITTTSGGFTIYPSQNILPEKSWNAEIGLKQGYKFGKFVGYADLAFFWQEYEDNLEYVMGFWKDTVPQIPGFKFLNTGDTRVRGIDFSIMGFGEISKGVSLRYIAGYTFVLPEAINPNQIFATDSGLVTQNDVVLIPQKEMSYYNSSSNPANNILKYRNQHTVNLDVEFKYKRLALGYSFRYYSNMSNIDSAFFYLDKYLDATTGGKFQWGVEDYVNTNDDGNYVMDARISYQISKKFKVALIMNNLLNRQYAIRPMKMEAPRTTAIQITFKV